MVMIAGAGAFLYIQETKRRQAEVAALEAQNAALRAQVAAQSRGRRGIQWEDVALGAIPIVGGIIQVIARAID